MLRLSNRSVFLISFFFSSFLHLSFFLPPFSFALILFAFFSNLFVHQLFLCSPADFPALSLVSHAFLYLVSRISVCLFSLLPFSSLTFFSLSLSTPSKVLRTFRSQSKNLLRRLSTDFDFLSDCFAIAAAVWTHRRWAICALPDTAERQSGGEVESEAS